MELSLAGLKARCLRPLGYRRLADSEGIEPPARGFGSRRSAIELTIRLNWCPRDGFEPPTSRLQGERSAY